MLQKEFLPQMEQLGVYVPGFIGGYFRDVCAWKQVLLSCPSHQLNPYPANNLCRTLSN